MTRNKASGFTLMEVMIAMTILAIALVAIYQSAITEHFHVHRLTFYDHSGPAGPKQNGRG
jgi:prepilin-type N-terminal cleavage/methylation domain-containing protein